MTNLSALKLTVLFLLTGYMVMGQSVTSQVLPTPEQVKWANAEIGVIIHLDMNIFAPDAYQSGDKASLPPLQDFHPSHLNTDQWVAAAKSAGAKYAILVAKHGTGFALWPSRANDYNVAHTPWKAGKGDIVADFIKSCKKYGIRPGVYYSVNNNTFYGTGRSMSDSARKVYNKAVLMQETELWTRYGKWFEIWFDGGILSTARGGVSDQIASMIHKWQPQAILFQGPSSCRNLIRWVGNERGDAPYPMWSRADGSTASNGMAEIKNLHGDPDGNMWCPAESDFPSRKKSAWEGGWFWRANREQDVISLEDLVKRYYTTVGRNTNMLIGMAIDTSGRFPEKESRLFAEFGKEIHKRFPKSIADTKGNGREVILKLGARPVEVNTIVMMEDIARGENIRGYAVDEWKNSAWVPVCDGISVGHERIQTFDPVETEKLRLRITNSKQTPVIERFAAYDINRQ